MSRWAIPLACVAVCALAIPVAVRGMTNSRWGREEAASVHLLPGYGWAPVGQSAYEPHWLDDYDTVAKYFDQRHLPDGSVLTDVQYTFPLILKSLHPHRFIIPSDHDYERAVADPATYRVRYLLISDGPNDSLSTNYPGLSPRTKGGRRFRPTVPCGPPGPLALPGHP